jgi:hypothetical protein
MLSSAHKSHFQVLGFVLLRQVFSPDEMQRINAAADELWQADRQGKPTSDGGQGVSPFVERSDFLTQIVADDRIFVTIEQLLGPGFIWAGSEGNVTAHAEHRWHADRCGVREVDYGRIKVMLYLDAMTRARGSLRVLPGSHRLPYHHDLEPLIAQQEESCLETFGVDGPDMPGFAVESQPGDVLFFDQCLWHAVFGGWPGRHYIALKYAAKPTAAEHIESLRHYSNGEIFRPDAAFLNSARPRIRGMVEKLPELGKP